MVPATHPPPHGSGYDSTTESALAKLFHLLGKYGDNEQVKALFDLDLKGEITK